MTRKRVAMDYQASDQWTGINMPRRNSSSLDPPITHPSDSPLTLREGYQKLPNYFFPHTNQAAPGPTPKILHIAMVVVSWTRLIAVRMPTGWGDEIR